MQKPLPSDFNLSQEKVRKINDRDIRVEWAIEKSFEWTLKIFSFVFLIVLALEVFSLVSSWMGWQAGEFGKDLFFGYFFIIFVTVSGAGFCAMLAVHALHWTVSKVFLRSYNRYQEVKIKYDQWFVRSKIEFWQKLSGERFRSEVSDLLEHLGYGPHMETEGNDRRDLSLADGTLVRCEVRSSPLSSVAVRELQGNLKQINRQRAILVSKGGFTDSVREFSHGRAISLWDVSTLVLLQKRLDEEAGGKGLVGL